MREQGFDERQLQIRGKVLFHAFITTAVLLLLNAFLNDFGFIWASGFHQNIIILMLIAGQFSIESIIRGAYFENKKKTKLVFILFSVSGVMLLVFSIRHMIMGSPLVENAMLSDTGFSLFFTILNLSIVATATIKEIKDKKAEDN